MFKKPEFKRPVFKRIIATFVAVFLGAGMSVAAVAAPAAAQTPTYNITCDSFGFQADGYGILPGDPEPNTVTITVDGATSVHTFGASLTLQTFALDGSTSHTWSVVMDAVGGLNDTEYDFSRSGATTPCSYRTLDWNLECKVITVWWGQAITEFSDIDIEVLTRDGIIRMSVDVITSSQGGYNDLLVVYTDAAGDTTSAALTEQQVKSGTFVWPFGDYMRGITNYKLLWANASTLEFNPPRNVANALSCDWQDPVTVLVGASAIAPTCLTDGRLVLPAQTGIVWTGGNDGAGPGTYTIEAEAASGYYLVAPYSVTIVVDPADKTLCNVEPAAAVQTGACSPRGAESFKATQFAFDNSLSQLEVTFTIPSIAGFAPVTVAAGATNYVLGPEVRHDVGASWQVFADGVLLTTLTTPTFPQCQVDLVAAVPTSTPATCVLGVVQNGRVTIVLDVGKIAYTITGPGNVTTAVTATETSLPPGTYSVTAVGIAPFSVGNGNSVTQTIEVLAPASCVQVVIPVSVPTQLACTASGDAEGSFTLPPTDFVEWYVNGDLTTAAQVTAVAPGDVIVEARITAAAQLLGTAFTDGTLSQRVTHTFVRPTPGCNLLVPTASMTAGSCIAAPTYTLSDTTSKHGGVEWIIDRQTVNPGVASGDWGETIIARVTLVDPVHDRFDAQQQTTWTFTFPAKPAICGDLVTLAFTGATGGFALWIAGAMLLLGGAGIYLSRRHRAVKG